MKKINSIALTHFHLATHVDYHKSIYAVMVLAGFLNPKWTTTLAAYKAAIDVLNDVVRRQQGSIYTEDVTAADARRDSTMGQIFMMIDAAVKSSVQEEKEAGKKLQIMVKPYRKDARDQMTDQTEDVRGMIQVLRGESAASFVSVLLLDGLIDRLEQQNEQFAELYRTRILDRESQPGTGVNTTAQRKETDTQYNALVEMLNSVSIAADAGIETGFAVTELNKLIDTVNAYVEQYKKVIANQGKR